MISIPTNQDLFHFDIGIVAKDSIPIQGANVGKKWLMARGHEPIDNDKDRWMS